MRVLTLCYEFPPIGGGGAGVAKGLATALARMGHTVDVVTMGFQDLPNEETIDGVHVHRIACGRKKENKCTAREAATYIIKAEPIVRRLLQTRSYDIIQAHFIFPDGVLAWRVASSADVPYVVTAHGTDVPGYNKKSFFKIVHPLLIVLWRMVTRRAAEIVSPSDLLAELIERARPNTRVIVIPNGIDTDKFRPLPKTKRILVATRFVERKGVQYLLHAVLGTNTGFPLIVAGGGEYASSLLKLNEELGKPAQFVGWMNNESPEFLRLLQESAIYALPSDFENFPMSVLEAMSTGAAIITTKGHGCEEAVGDTAELVTPGNIDFDACVREIRAALIRLTGDEAYREELGRRARKRVEDHFSWPAVAGRYEEVYLRHIRDPRASEARAT